MPKINWHTADGSLIAGGDTYEIKDTLKRVGFQWKPAPEKDWRRSIGSDQKEYSATPPVLIDGKDVDRIPGPIYKALWKHQKKFLARIVKDNSSVAADYGLASGKTLVILAYATALQYSNQLADIIVIVPNSVKSVWEREYKKWIAPLKKAPALIVPDGSTKDKANQITALPTDRVNIIVTNYDSYWRQPLYSALLDRPYNLAVMDESHYVKTAKSNRARAGWKLMRQAQRRVIMSGTMVNNSPLDLWQQYAQMEWSVFGCKRQEFNDKFGIINTWTGEVSQWLWDDIKAQTEPLTIHAVTSQLIDLPDEMDIHVPVVPDADEIADYNGIQEPYKIQELTTQYMASGRFVDRQCQLAIILSDTSEQVIIYCAHTNEIDTAIETAKSLGLTVAQLDGRKDQEADWLDNKAQVLVVQYQSGSEGKNWQQSHIVIYYSPTWSYDKYFQSRGRIRRPGQLHKCQYYHLRADGFIDSDIYAALSRKEDFSENFKRPTIPG